MEIDLSAVNKFAFDLGRASLKAVSKAHKILSKTAFDIEREAKTFAPVDTGNLRNSISTDIGNSAGRAVSSMTAVIGPTAEYGAYVEYGTSRMAPQAYLGPAFDRNVGYMETALLTVLDDLMDGD